MIKVGKPSTEKIIRDRHLSNITVTSFYCQSAIEQLALKVSSTIFSIRNKKFILQFSNQFVFHPLTMMYIGKTHDDGHL